MMCSPGVPEYCSWTRVRRWRPAPEAAHLLAAELGRDEAWQRQQVQEFTEIAGHYVVKS